MLGSAYTKGTFRYEILYVNNGFTPTGEYSISAHSSVKLNKSSWSSMNWYILHTVYHGKYRSLPFWKMKLTLAYHRKALVIVVPLTTSILATGVVGKVKVLVIDFLHWKVNNLAVIVAVEAGGNHRHMCPNFALVLNQIFILFCPPILTLTPRQPLDFCWCADSGKLRCETQLIFMTVNCIQF